MTTLLIFALRTFLKKVFIQHTNKLQKVSHVCVRSCLCVLYQSASVIKLKSKRFRDVGPTALGRHADRPLTFSLDAVPRQTCEIYWSVKNRKESKLSLFFPKTYATRFFVIEFCVMSLFKNWCVWVKNSSLSFYAVMLAIIFTISKHESPAPLLKGRFFSQTEPECPEWCHLCSRTTQKANAS